MRIFVATYVKCQQTLAKRILPLFPEYSYYVEPFGGAVVMYLMKDQAEVEVLNHINGELVK